VPPVDRPRATVHRWQGGRDIRVYQTQKAGLHEKARELIAAGKVDADGELWITVRLGPE